MGSNERRHRRTIRQSIALVVILVVGYFGYQTYAESVRNAGTVEARVQLPGGKEIGPFRLEVVSTPSQRAKGMMFRRRDQVREDQGMLFIFPEERPQKFWMKNTFIPLDMIFVNSELKVVGIVHEAVPLSLEERGVPAPAKYVIEVLGGIAQKQGISEGAQVSFNGELPKGS